jgi:hypothetical protein
MKQMYVKVKQPQYVQRLKDFYDAFEDGRLHFVNGTPIRKLIKTSLRQIFLDAGLCEKKMSQHLKTLWTIIERYDYCARREARDAIKTYLQTLNINYKALVCCPDIYSEIPKGQDKENFRLLKEIRK